MAKTTCSVTRTVFTAEAQSLTIQVGDDKVVAQRKEFSTGSFGWYYSGKIPVTLPTGETVMVQANLSLPVIGSKEAA